MSVIPFNFTESPALNFSNPDKWAVGLSLNVLDINSSIYPKNIDEKWLTTIKGSFISHILTQQTSFIVLENEAQKQALLKKQKTVLNSKKALDIGDENRMSEPPFWIILIGVFFLLLYKNKGINKHLNN